MTDRSSFVVVANRLPVDEVTTDPTAAASGAAAPAAWSPRCTRSSPSSSGTWVGWAGGDRRRRPSRSTSTGIRLHPVPLSAEELERYYEGQSNATIWPLYHDAVETAGLPPALAGGLPRVNRAVRRGGRRGAPAEGATVWVQDYQLQLVPGDAARAAPRPAHRLLPAHPVPADRAVHAAAAARRDPPRAARRRPGRLPAARWRAQNFVRLARHLLGLRRRRAVASRSTAAWCGPARSRSRSTSTRWSALAADPDVQARAERDPRRARATRRRSSSASTGSTTPRASSTGSRPTASCSPTAG